MRKILAAVVVARRKETKYIPHLSPHLYKHPIHTLVFLFVCIRGSDNSFISSACICMTVKGFRNRDVY